MFLISRGELEGRFDPIYYCNELFGFLKTTQYAVKKISDVAVSLKSGFGAGKQDQEQEGNGIVQIRPTNVGNEGNLKFDKNVYLPLDLLETQQNNLLQKGDVLFNNTNSQELVGKTALFNEDGNFLFSNHITRIRTKNDVLPQFLVLLLNSLHSKKLFYSICTNWNNQSGVGIELLRSLKIPVPPLEIQAKIISIFETAYNSKKQKETEAAQLLASIDGYLLEALGITLPPTSEKKTFFITNSSKISGGRFDPKKYVPENEQLIKSLGNGKYESLPLKDFLLQSVSGDWGIEDAKEGFKKALVIRATEFDNLFNLKLDNSRVKYRFINEIKLEKMDLQVNDLLIEKSGGSENQPVGRIAIITQELADNHSLAFSNFIHKIRVDTARLHSDYLFSFLKTIHNIKITDLMQSQTNGIRNLIMREYLNIQIPLPPLEKQTEIADHISALRSQAKQLQHEAQTELERAKSEVERMILGDE